MNTGASASDTEGMRRPFKTFDTALHAFEGMDAELTANLTLAAADLAIVVDHDDVIVDVAYDDPALSKEPVPSWVGRTWTETVTAESQAKIKTLLEEARSGQLAQSREINHTRPDPLDLPVRYRAAPLKAKGMVIALGTDLRPLSRQQQQLVDAQIKMEQDYAKMRQAEARFRLVFQLASEAIIVADAGRDSVVDANAAALELLGKALDRLNGQKLASLFNSVHWSSLTDLLGAVRTGSKPSETMMELSTGRQVRVTVSMVNISGTAQFLVRLRPEQPAHGAVSDDRITRAVEALPDGFVVTDKSGQILIANNAFADIVGLVNPGDGVGAKLERWLGRSQIDADVMFKNLHEHGALRNFETMLRDEYGSIEEIEVTAVAVSNGDLPCYGFLIRRFGGTLRAHVEELLPDIQSANRLKQLIGRVSLKELVRQSTDMIEKLCIEAALDLTQNNRASAAEMLGVSRQSFYQKLNRYGIA